MKRRAVLTAIILIIAVLSANIAFAENTILIAPAPSGTLQIVKTVPDNGEEGKQVTNMAVKIVFDEDVSASANDAAMKASFILFIILWVINNCFRLQN